MAMELRVFFRGELPSKAALARAIKELGFPLSITSTAGSLEQQKGFMPMRLKREKTGVEFDVFDGRDTIEEIANGLEIDPSFDRSANFRWGGDESEMLCALCAAAALAQFTGGIALGEDDEQPLSPDEAITVARQHLEAAAKPKDKGPGTTPADIKRFLKPLLHERSDLVLMGRLLVIRPVRHLLRGALFERTSDKYTFRIWWYVQALYDPYSSLGYGDYIFTNTCAVWQPHFEPLLMDALADDIFSRVGPMTTLGDFADALAGSTRLVDFSYARVKALVLGGERGRAVDLVREYPQRGPDKDYWRNWAKEQRKFLARDIKDVCAECHAQEAETVKAMKLEAIWEPSPFPAELTAHESARSAEPHFRTTSWMGRPSWLLDDVPDRPGDIRFAKDLLYRDGRRRLLVPLSRDEAEERHRNGEPYVLAARLSDGLLVMVWCTGRDRHDPAHSGKPRGAAGLSLLEMDGANYLVQISPFTAWDGDGRRYLGSFAVHERITREQIWYCSNNVEEGQTRISDDRERRKRIRSNRALTDAERELITYPIPNFGEFEDIVTRARTWLRSAGYGEMR